MAQRRMFSKDIVRSDAFLDMPQSTQLLYFHLGMEADDDGFIANSKTVARMVGSSADDIKVLIAKRFVLTFESGIIVVKHWKINNYIQKDRHKETKYLKEKNQIKTKENSVYTECIQNGHLGKVRLEQGKSKSKVRGRENAISEEIATPAQEAKDFFEKKEKQENIIQYLIGKGLNEVKARHEVEKFVLYWTEPNSTGKKERWQMQKTFDVKRRFVTWIGRVQEFGKNKSGVIKI